jgi:hypothetical protein
MLERNSDTGRVTSSEPEEDPVGMGVQGILRNMFGVRSTVGTETQGKLNEHAKLLSLGGNRTVAQEKRFKKITEELEDTGFGREFRDPDYATFRRAIARRPEFKKPVLSVKEVKEQEVIADKILDDVLAKGKKKK